MSCFGGGGPKASKEERQRNKAIEDELSKAKKELSRDVKLLLLGTGESGKSTVAKQMKIIYLDGFSDDERDSYTDIIHTNIIQSIQALIEATETFQMELSNDIRPIADKLIENQGSMLESQFNPTIAKEVTSVWNDPCIQSAYARAAEFQLNDSAAYYFEHIDRIAEEGYRPTVMDILRSRARTTGIVETEFVVDKTRFRMLDMGGQRSERRKWIQCFEDVTAVIFVVALSEYNQKLIEDAEVNRMHESLKLFHEIRKLWFPNTSIILFLNKSDLFKEKIQHVDLKLCFPRYTGGKDYETAVGYIREKFVRNRENIYPHVTCATDTENVKFVFNVVQETILRMLFKEYNPM